MSQDFSDILTSDEVKSINHVLSAVSYKPRLMKLIEHNVVEAEKKHPLGTHGSTEAYTKGDGLEIELGAIILLERSKDPKIAQLGEKMYHAYGKLEEDTYYNAHDSARVTLNQMEDASPMAPTFAAARKVLQHGREVEGWKGYPKGF